MRAKLSLLLPVAVVTLCAMWLAHGDSGQVVPAPAWEYRFPPGLLDTANFVATSDLSYLAIAGARWTYHPRGNPQQLTTEGENAAYLFDLRNKRLVWKQAFPDGLAAYVLGITDSAEFVAVRVGRQWGGSFEMPRTGERKGEEVEGIQVLGIPEPGARLYDRGGRLVASQLPLERIGGRQPSGALMLRAPREGEVAPPDELQARLAAEGVQQMTALPSRRAVVGTRRDGVPYVVGLGPDGTVRWEWRLPGDEGKRISRDQVLVTSPDGQYTMASYVVTQGASCPNARRFHLFHSADGWQWSREFPLEISGHVTWSVSNGGRAALILQEMSGSYVVNALGLDGQTRSSFVFSGIGPGKVALSLDGSYWAASFGRRAEGPGVDDMGWSEGLHVFDCTSGEVVWRSPMEDAREVLALDSGGAVAIYGESPILAVFDPPR